MKGTKLSNHCKESYDNISSSTNLNMNDSIYDENFNSVFGNHPDGVFILNVYGHITKYNHSLIKILGCRDRDLPVSVSEFFICNQEILRTHFQFALKGVTQNFTIRFSNKCSKAVETEITFIPIFNTQKTVIGIFGLVKDLTNYIQNQIELDRLKSNLEYAERAAKVGSWEHDLIENEIYLSNQAYLLFGLKETENHSPTYNQLLHLIHPEDRDKFDLVFKNSLINRESYRIEYRILHDDDSIVYVFEQGEIILDESLHLVKVIGTIQDITDLKAKEQKINHLAFHDHLTDLPNSRLFTETMNRLITKAESTFFVLILNIDRFKNINNTVGRGIGDRLIELFSDRVNHFLKKDTMFARLGGDEFGIISLNESEDPFDLARMIINQMKEPFYIDAYEIYLTTCIGISHFPSDGNTGESLLKNANIALSRAKETGKNNYQLYGSSIDLASLKMFSLEPELYKAIQNEELFLHFQPRVAAATGKMLSAEALIRWEHPYFGTISPKDFVPIAEENGLILEIGDWVIRKVCQFIKKWKQQNYSIVPISINISAQRFLKNDLIDTLKQILQETEVDPTFIEIEITESTLIQHEEIVNSTLKSLKEMGVRVALDDFGTGYSSLTYLKKFPIDTIKIDQSFIRNIGKSHSDEIIIQSVLFLAKGLDKRTVAEGVETYEQLLFLQQQGCDEIQGYLFSKSASIQDFQLLLKNPFLNPKVLNRLKF